MARRFATKNGVKTNVLNSYDFYKASYKKRQEGAFNKKLLSELSPTDKALMRGYAQRIVEEQQAFKYHHPNYRRKTNSSGF